jgi:hypothetical protein
MKKLVVAMFAVIVASSTFLGLYVNTAQSRPQYLGQFKGMYIKPDGTDDEKALAAAFNGLQQKCLVCHVAGQPKKERNSYGKELAKIITPADATGFKGEMDKDKINEALKKVADVHTDPNDPKSPTYGDLLKSGKLPAGDSK